MGNAIEQCRINSICRLVFLISVGVVFVLSLFIRFHNLDHPAIDTVFDENKFTHAADLMLMHKGHFNDHPAFGKMLVALGMEFLGRNELGARVPSAVAGILLVLVLSLVSWQLFRSVEGAFAVFILSLADAFLVAYSRLALTDIFLAFLGYSAILLALLGKRRSLIYGILAGCCAGLAGAVKYNGFWCLGPIILIYLLSRRKSGVLAVISASLMTYMLVALIAQFNGSPDDVLFGAWKWQTSSWKFHTTVLPLPPESSSWYRWFLMENPVTLHKRVFSGDSIRVIITLANPLLLVAGGLLVSLCLIYLIARKFGLCRVIPLPAQSLSILLASYSCGLLPWIFIARPSLFYHYLPSYCSLVLLCGSSIGLLERRFKIAGKIFFVIFTLCALLYLPFASAVPLPIAWERVLLPFHCWRETCFLP